MNGEDELARRIAHGHAKDHWPNLSEDELAVKIQDVLENFVRAYPVGPVAARKIYQAADGTTVIVDPSHDDGGTVFVPHPKSPIQYFKDFVDDY